MHGHLALCLIGVKAREIVICSYFTSMLNSQAYLLLEGHCVILTRGWFPDTYFHCLHQIRVVTIDGDDDGGELRLVVVVEMIMMMVMTLMVMMTMVITVIVVMVVMTVMTG